MKFMTRLSFIYFIGTFLQYLHADLSMVTCTFKPGDIEGIEYIQTCTNPSSEVISVSDIYNIKRYGERFCGYTSRVRETKYKIPNTEIYQTYIGSSPSDVRCFQFEQIDYIFAYGYKAENAINDFILIETVIQNFLRGEQAFKVSILDYLRLTISGNYKEFKRELRQASVYKINSLSKITANSFEFSILLNNRYFTLKYSRNDDDKLILKVVNEYIL